MCRDSKDKVSVGWRKGRGEGGGGAGEGSSWASFQSKKDLDEQRFVGFSFLVLVTFQSVERKRSMLLFGGRK